MNDKQKLISSRETKTGNLSETQKEQVRYLNENPSFDPKSKPYKFIKKIKTDTRNHGWVFEFNGKIFVALQSWIARQGEGVSFYRASQKGDFSIDRKNLVKRYKFLVDVETAVDRFTLEFKDI